MKVNPQRKSPVQNVLFAFIEHNKRKRSVLALLLQFRWRVFFSWFVSWIISIDESRLSFLVLFFFQFILITFSCQSILNEVSIPVHAGEKGPAERVWHDGTWDWGGWELWESRYATWELFSIFGPHFCPFSLFRYRKYLFSENQRVLGFKCRFYTNSSRLFVSCFYPSFFLLPPFPTPFCPAVSTIHGCNTWHKAWGRLNGAPIFLHSSTLHIQGWIYVYGTIYTKHVGLWVYIFPRTLGGALGEPDERIFNSLLLGQLWERKEY